MNMYNFGKQLLSKKLSSEHLGNAKYGNDLFPLKEICLVLQESLVNGFHVIYH